MKNIIEDDTVARTPRNASQLTMKVLIAAFAVFTAVAALQNQYSPNYNDVGSGQYVADDSGQYVPDDSGRYVPDYSGSYIPDGLGGYIQDGSGGYRGDGSGAYTGGGGAYTGGDGAYKGDGGAYNGGNGAYAGGAFGGSGKGGRGQGGAFGGKGSGGIGTTNLLGSGSNQDRQTIKPANPFGAGLGTGSGHGIFGNTASATSQVSSKYSGNTEGSRYADGRWKIIRQSGDVDLDGYHWEYETENGITAEESGKLANKGTDAEVMKAKGFFQYTGPDNARYYVTYTADENGFIPSGDHLPTPPPVPAAISRSLDYLKSIGKL